MSASLRDRLPGASALAKQLRDRIHEVADSDAPILIEGERGTGREWVARQLHALGPRKGARFVRVDPDEPDEGEAGAGSVPGSAASGDPAGVRIVDCSAEERSWDSVGMRRAMVRGGE